MSVYTRIEAHQLEDLLSHYQIGELVDFNGIADGIENTNYHIITTNGQYILTIYEHLEERQIGFYVELLEHLSQQKLSVPTAITRRNGEFLSFLSKKPAALFNRIEGTSPAQPTLDQCTAIGKWLAKLHLTTQQFSFDAQTLRAPFNYKIMAQHQGEGMDASQKQLVQGLVNDWQAFEVLDLPCGLIHGDLFRDNALFCDNTLSAVLDFYSASYEALVLDLAITLNDWCRTPNNQLDSERFRALMGGYQAIRVLTSDEYNNLPLVIRIAAFRFWLSRMEEGKSNKTGALTHQKNPNEFKELIEWLSEGDSFI